MNGEGDVSHYTVRLFRNPAGAALAQGLLTHVLAQIRKATRLLVSGWRAEPVKLFVYVSVWSGVIGRGLIRSGWAMGDTAWPEERKPARNKRVPSTGEGPYLRWLIADVRDCLGGSDLGGWVQEQSEPMLKLHRRVCGPEVPGWLAGAASKSAVNSAKAPSSAPAQPRMRCLRSPTEVIATRHPINRQRVALWIRTRSPVPRLGLRRSTSCPKYSDSWWPISPLRGHCDIRHLL